MNLDKNDVARLNSLVDELNSLNTLIRMYRRSIRVAEGEEKNNLVNEQMMTTGKADGILMAINVICGKAPAFDGTENKYLHF